MPEDPVVPAPWVAVLEELVAARRHLDLVEYHAVQMVRGAGATWEDIGEAYGISRQAARQRFSQPRRRQRPGAGTG